VGEQTKDSAARINNGLEGRECVPFFKTDKSQIIFEFVYLIVAFFAAVGLLARISHDRINKNG